MLCELSHESLVHNLVFHFRPVLPVAVSALSKLFSLGWTLVKSDFLLLLDAIGELHGLEVVLSGGPYLSIYVDGTLSEIAQVAIGVLLPVEHDGLRDLFTLDLFFARTYFL